MRHTKAHADTETICRPQRHQKATKAGPSHIYFRLNRLIVLLRLIVSKAGGRKGRKKGERDGQLSVCAFSVGMRRMMRPDLLIGTCGRREIRTDGYFNGRW